MKTTHKLMTYIASGASSAGQTVTHDGFVILDVAA